MTALAEAPRFPEALDDDHDDVAWALQTAGVQWNRGGQADAIVWLRRAVDAAIELGAHDRAQELNRVTESLAAYLDAGGDVSRVSGPRGDAAARVEDDDVDELLAGELPSVEVGSYELATQSLVDAVELESQVEASSRPPARSVDDDALLLLDDEDEREEGAVSEEAEEEIEEIDEIEVLDEDEPAAPVAARPATVAPLPPPKLPPPTSPRPPLPPPRLPPPPTPPAPRLRPASSRPAPAPSRPAPAASRPAPAASRPAPAASRPAPAASRPAPARSRPAPSRPVQARRDFEPDSSPAQVPYSVAAERVEETTQRRSAPYGVETSAPSEPLLERPRPSRPAASQPYFEDEEGPTGILGLPAAALAELEAEAESQARTEAEDPVFPYAAEDEITISEPLAPESADEVIAPPSLAPEPEPPANAYREEAPSGIEGDAPLADDDGPLGEGAELEVPGAEPEVESESAAEGAATGPQGEPAIGEIVLAEVRGLEDLPPEAQLELVAKARVEVLGPEEEVSAFGLALVLKGEAAVMPAIADVACASARAGDPVFCAGNLENGVEMRLVARAEGAEVAVWQSEDFEGAMRSCPWVADELREVADRFQALAGATMGPLGDQLDDMMRSMVTERCQVKRLEPGEVLLEKGRPLPGLHVVGAGRLEIEGAGAKLPGDFLFAQQILGGGATPATVRAGAQGALLLFVDRMTAHELMMSVPPLLEVLATA